MLRTGRALRAVAALSAALLLSGCIGGSASVEVLARSRTPLQGEAVDEYDAPVLRGDLSKAISVFGVDLLDSVAGEDENVVVSPFSAYSALALAQGAAEADTLDEMRAALRTSGIDPGAADASYADLLAQLRFKVKDTPARLDIANSVWLRSGLAVDQGFIDRNAAYYGAQMARLDMGSDAAPDAINRWVRDNTGGKIDKLVEEMDPDTVAVLCNAVYFKDAWWTPFEKSATSDRDFHLRDGSTVRVPTMAGGADGSYIDTDTYAAVALPTKGGAEFWIFVPKDDKKPADVLSALKATYSAGGTLGAVSSHRPGSIFLPKFDIEWKGTLKPSLVKMGMRRPFDRSQAQFPHLSPERDRVWISEVVQAATTAIDEEGFEAAAATEVGMVATAGSAQDPFELHADRPFVYAITMGDAMLFMGVVNDPR